MSRAHLHRKAKNIIDETKNEEQSTTSDPSVLINKELSNDETKGKKLRVKVNLELMKQELKQLEDPPGTSLERMLSINRLKYDFFNIPCEDLAQNLLGKILVRKLENGTILKGKIVETESYLAGIDKASQTYQYKLTPRTLPLYLPSGTIYVYMTYGMYCCVNISCQVPQDHVLIRSIEPLTNLDYIELLMNMRKIPNVKETYMASIVKSIEPHTLCNTPSKICTAFVIDEETYNGENVDNSNSLWIERNPNQSPISIVAAPRIDDRTPQNRLAYRHLRFYILGNPCEGAAVLIRALEPIEGIDQMTAFRLANSKSKNPQKNSKVLKPHEICNGPSKLCMALQIAREHCKYSIVTWKGMWIEIDTNSTNENIQIVKCPRIGIESAGPEWANKPLRYYIYGNSSVSKRNKKAEAAFTISE
ncbi:hypothetical protein PV326_003526 [Microctonus aethiopoides]|nr:hypothetical protein PV326_003526 [Microctonus aethiopoides]